MRKTILSIVVLLVVIGISGRIEGAEKPGRSGGENADTDMRTTAPPENPPRILVAASIDDDDNLQLVQYRSIFIGFKGESYNNRSLARVPLEGVKIVTVGGEVLTVEAARKRLEGRDTPILATPYGAPVPRFYASLFAPDTLHFIFPKRAPDWKEIQDPGRPVR